MLVLSRREGEKLYVGDDVVVTVLSIQGNRVRIGIEAPAEVHVVRKELLSRERRKPANAQRTVA